MAVYRIRKDSLFLTELPMYGEKRLGVMKENRFLMKKPTQNGNATPVIVTASKPPAKTSIYPLGKKHYETTDWLGNVRVTYTEKKSWNNGKFALNVSSSQDYYPFGSVMEGRMYNLAAYRFGFNGKENDNEVIGMGRWQDYGARMYRPDLARFFSPDPIIEQGQKYAELSTYQFASNTPIMAIDLDGLESLKIHKKLKRRNKPKIGNDIRGTGLIVWLGGTRGKYFKHNSLQIIKKSKFQYKDNSDDFVGKFRQPKDNTDIDVTGKNPLDNSNPIDRDSRYGEDRTIENRTDLLLKFNEGELIVTFEPEVDEEGNFKEVTLEIGKIDKNGREVILRKIKTNKPGTVKVEFKLEKGEKLFKRIENAKGTTTKATKK
ncbi:MAG: hypothetical protein KatS3mg035_2189 [Bacteroidia bacterium]|nr:MAG: hypothetical protein KatS3mg035_2189 [Bacteroidia bacterium]